MNAKNTRLTVNQIANVTLYGVHWGMDFEDRRERLTSLETTAHILACLVSQNLIDDGVETSAMVELIEDNPSLPKLVRRIKRYVSLA